MPESTTKKELRRTFPGFRGNLDHLTKLLEGRDSWNAWREEVLWEGPRADAIPSLAGLRLPPKSTSTPQASEGLRSALEMLKMERSDLRAALESEAAPAWLGLYEAKLDDVNVATATLAGFNFERADLRGLTMKNGSLEGAILKEANLAGADLQAASLKRADLTECDLTDAILEEAELRGAQLRRAECLRADLRTFEPEHMVLDETRIRDAYFSPGSGDPWNSLVRNYSGPMFSLNLLFLILYLIPLVARAAWWGLVNQLQKLGERVGTWEEDLGPCLANWSDCVETRPIFLVLELQPFSRWSIVALILLFYNAARWITTARVARLRDAAAQAGVTPPKGSYWTFYQWHMLVLRWLMWIALGLGSLHILDFLFLTCVWVR